MASAQEQTTVVIIGGGVSGLTLATFQKNSGIACVVLERRDRSYIASRQRAGVVEARGVQMFEKWELADKLLAGPIASSVEYRLNGVGRVFEIGNQDDPQSRFCTQQMLVNNLLRVFIDEMGGDVRFEVQDVVIHNEENARPKVCYTDKSGAHELACDYIAGCDADRGVSRASIPAGVIKTYTHEFGYSWLAMLVEAPVAGPALMAASDHGFVAQIPRGPQRSRYYLQCASSDVASDWPDDRVWDEVRLRTGNHTIQNARIHDRLFVPLRSLVHVPMQHRNLFLVGDAAHLVPPTGAKGMNMALFDVDVLAHGLLKAIRHQDRSGLENYTNDCLPRVWKYQEFSVWMTDTMHDAGDSTRRGKFLQGIARARLDMLFDSPAAEQFHSDFQRGMI